MDSQETSQTDERDLNAEVVRLNKVIKSLMDRAERNAGPGGSDYHLFHTAVTFEKQVHARTRELEAALRENEKITRALRESENRNRLLVDNSPMCIHEISLNGNVISMNRSGQRMLGLQSESEVLGRRYLDLVGEEDRPRIADLMAKAFSGETSDFEFHLGEAHGRDFKSCFVPLRERTGRVEKLMGITEDITERKEAERRIRELAFYDVLTHLANRRLLGDRLEQAMMKSKRTGCHGALIFLDLDNFKPLNDTHGHEVGDQLLIEVAARISGCVRELDTVARFGGDEFVVMLAELYEDRQQSREQACAVAEKIRTALAAPYLLSRKSDTGEAQVVEHSCTASIGVVLFWGQESSSAALLKQADAAMYQAKASGRNRICFTAAGE
jgi:diguanylate cyclase (GGDEF)-like protein/PAS domain S-box-containing protein